jgi:hypothetical protein
MTWPLGRNLGRAVSDPGDPLIVTWILDWDFWATLHQPLRLFQANTFYPAQYALAFSENLYGVALLFFPLRLLGVSALTTFNLAMLAGFAFCGFAAYLLAWHLTESRAAAVAAGVFYAFLPFRFVHLPHLQHVWGGWLPLLLYALLRYGQRPTWRRGAFVGVVFLMNGLTNIHYLFFGALALVVTALLLLPRPAWKTLAVALLLAGVLLLPFLYPYAVVSKIYGMQRTAGEVLGYSAALSDWLPHQGEPEVRLYPGALALVLSAAGLVAGWRSRRAASSKLLAVLWIAIGFLGSLGFHTQFHTFLYGAVPGFRAIRVPARWAVIAYVGMAILIAVATMVLAQRSRLVAWVVPIAFVVTLHQAPLRWYFMDPKPAPVYEWLAAQPGAGAIAELPISRVNDYEAMYRATVHHRKLVNGVSGFAPPVRLELETLWSTTPIPASFVDRLSEIRVELLIVHADALGGHLDEVRARLRRELDARRLTFVQRFDSPELGDWVFRVGTAADTPRPPLLEAFLGGARGCSANETMGGVDYPSPAETVRGQAMVSGWTMSPHGIRSIDISFDNGRVHYVPGTRDEPPRTCWGKPATRFVLVIPERPADVSERTDVLVEVTDGRGVKTMLTHRWMTWTGP